jgi:hypothetical protein
MMHEEDKMMTHLIASSMWSLIFFRVPSEVLLTGGNHEFPVHNIYAIKFSRICVKNKCFL